MEKRFNVTTKHPTGHSDGVHVFTVRVASDLPGAPTKYYATAAGFGCGKDYPSPRGAIVGLCTDHACQVIRVEEIATQPTPNTKLPNTATCIAVREHKYGGFVVLAMRSHHVGQVEYVTWLTDAEGNASLGHYYQEDIAKAVRDFKTR